MKRFVQKREISRKSTSLASVFAEARRVTKKKIERWTLWVLAIGILVAVGLNVAKSIVRDYRDLQQEIHRPAATPAERDESAAR